jgi:predicted  nucleic acid-binding Zn-ribbon protein
MKVRILTTLCLALTLMAFGCDKKTDAPTQDDEANAEAPAAEEQAEAPGEAEAAETEETENEQLEEVEVATAGTNFDPAVEVEQMPEGAWYCDMGTVHWAAMEKPEDGTCPECGMKLKHYDPEALAAQKEKAVEAHDHDHDGEGHAHDDEGHGHGGEGHAHDDEGHAHDDEGHGHAH